MFLHILVANCGDYDAPPQMDREALNEVYTEHLRAMDDIRRRNR